MVTQRLEICIELMKMAVDLIAAVAEAVDGAFFRQHPSSSSAVSGGRNNYSAVPVPLVGFLP
ncbi:PREDICTED: uncharacterized protein LOC109116326 [Tarenaya hassleriana]|uniref:uncharacterized protein LOC109116326 n=1 Tax=Tarenaya hassleriana TaxID=28532 RepID=UPI0008FD107D|nr:PREDICTED: uncharacterized protein LOC109116326 [Tarenaya hassleriana]